MAGSMRCHYCEQEVRDVWDYQRDHFPRPKAKGGKATVIACNRCHHIKDRSQASELLKQFDRFLDSRRGQPDPADLWESWTVFLSEREARNAQAAADVARLSWQTWPLELRLLAGRILREMDW